METHNHTPNTDLSSERNTTMHKMVGVQISNHLKAISTLFLITITLTVSTPKRPQRLLVTTATLPVRPYRTNQLNKLKHKATQ